jgi:apolipoprotein N-acyltransferase
MRRLDIPMSDFLARQAARRAADVAGQRVAINVCYEDVFGDEIARALPRRRCSSTCRTSPGSAIRSRRASTCRWRACARRDRRMHLTATNTGITGGDRPRRRVLSAAASTPRGARGAAQGYRGTTPYALWTDWPVVVLCVGVLAWLTFVARRRPSR